MRKKKLKILMYNRWVGYNEGGNETHIKELAVFLSKQGHKIDMLTTGDEALEGIRQYINKVHTVSSPREYFSYSSKRFYYSIKYLYESFLIMRRLFKNNPKRYDVVTVHFSLEALLLRLVRFLYGVPYVLILVGDTDLELIEGKRANNTSQLTHYMGRECVPYGYYPEILTKGVDTSRFNTKISGAGVRKQYIKNKNQILVISVCRLDPRKNLETLIKSAVILEKKHKNKFKYVIVGGGIEEKKLHAMVKRLKLEEVVYFTGMLPSTSDLLPRHYAAADIFAMPTLYEGFGYVFSEAMAFGLPVIGTDTSAVPEVIEDVGIVVPVKAPREFAAAIESLYLDKKLRKELVKKGKRKVEGWYWENIIGKYEKFIYKGIEKYNLRPSGVQRFNDFVIPLMLDLPLMFFVGFKTLANPRNAWGSLFRKD